MTLELWTAFALTSLVLLLFPGPVVTLLVATGMGRGRGAALRMIPGVVLGDVVAIGAALLGVGALLVASAALFTAVKWAGAAYLVWLGVRMWRDAGRSGHGRLDGPAAGSPRRAFLVTVLNPKTIPFFVAFLPQFTDPAAPAAPQLVLLALTFLALSAITNSAYAWFAGGLAGVLGGPGRRLVQRFGAGGLIGAGILTAGLRRA